MIPGMNPRKMNQMMKRMGISQVDIPAVKVIIQTEDKEFVFENPHVSKVNMMGQMTYQVVGEPFEQELSENAGRETSPEINEDDIQTVMDQAQVDRETALAAIGEADGDLAEAILNITQKE